MTNGTTSGHLTDAWVIKSGTLPQASMHRLLTTFMVHPHPVHMWHTPAVRGHWQCAHIGTLGRTPWHVNSRNCSGTWSSATAKSLPRSDSPPTMMTLGIAAAKFATTGGGARAGGTGTTLSVAVRVFGNLRQSIAKGLASGAWVVVSNTLRTCRTGKCCTVSKL